MKRYLLMLNGFCISDYNVRQKGINSYHAKLQQIKPGDTLELYDTETEEFIMSNEDD